MVNYTSSFATELLLTVRELYEMEFDPEQNLHHIFSLEMQSSLVGLLKERAGIRARDKPVACRSSSSTDVGEVDHSKPGQCDLADGLLELLEPVTLLLIMPETGGRR